MTPANPPPPTAWNLPFHPEGGIQTSKLTAGLTRPTTRHADGVSIGRGACAGAAPAGTGGVNGPAGTSAADTIVVSGSESDFRLSQDCASAVVASVAASRSTV